MPEPPETSPARPPSKPYERENDNLKGGEPPRPATEPEGAAGSSRSDKTLTNPATGAPNP